MVDTPPDTNNQILDIETLLENNMMIDAADLTYQHIIDSYKIATMRDSKEMYVYNGNGIYQLNGEEVVHTQITRLFGKYFNVKAHQQIKSRVQGDTYTERKEFNKDIDLVPLENGVLNIKTNELLPHDPKYKFTFKIPVKYDPEATCPKIDKFIKEVFKPEDVPIAYEIIAYCLLREMPIHKAFMLLGEGKNGKTTFLNLVTAFVGDDNISSRTIQDIVYNTFAASNLYGKLANISDDIPSTILKITGKFKMLTGGGVMSYEKKHKDAGSFFNYAKMVFAANQLPACDDDSYAYFRRWCIIEFPNFFDGDECNTNLSKEITTPEELSGILNKAIGCLGNLLKRGEFTVGSTKDIEQEYVRRSNSTAAFFNEMVVRDATTEPITREDLFGLYTQFCDVYDLPSTTQNEFTKKVPVFVPYVSSCRKRKDGKEYRAWKGVKVCSLQGVSTDGGENKTDSRKNSYFQKGILEEVSTKSTLRETIHPYARSDNNDNNDNNRAHARAHGGQLGLATSTLCTHINVESFIQSGGEAGQPLELIRARFPEASLDQILNELKLKGLIFEWKVGFYKAVNEGVVCDD